MGYRIILLGLFIGFLLTTCGKEQSISSNTGQMNPVPKDTMEMAPITEDSISVDTMSTDTMSTDTMPQDTISQDTITQDTMPKDTTDSSGGPGGIPTLEPVAVEIVDCDLNFSEERIFGCDGTQYPRPKVSPYTLPFSANQNYPLGLNNCSSSYHSSGSRDQYAYDFDMPLYSEFVAIRGGSVVAVENDMPSDGGGGGNYISISHGDGTYADYAHSPRDGIFKKVGQTVERGEVLGITGRSGFAGYPHLHLIVGKGNDITEFEGIPITFANARPAHNILISGRTYTACEYISKDE